MKKVAAFNKAHKTYTIKVEYILTFVEMCRRVAYECEMYGLSVPVTRSEVFDICYKQIIGGKGVGMDDPENIGPVSERMKHLFPELV